MCHVMYNNHNNCFLFVFLQVLSKCWLCLNLQKTARCIQMHRVATCTTLPYVHRVATCTWLLCTANWVLVFSKCYFLHVNNNKIFCWTQFTLLSCCWCCRCCCFSVNFCYVIMMHCELQTSVVYWERVWSIVLEFLVPCSSLITASNLTDSVMSVFHFVTTAIYWRSLWLCVFYIYHHDHHLLLLMAADKIQYAHKHTKIKVSRNEQ